MRNYLLLIGMALLCACGPRGGKPASVPVRDFPQVDVPSMYSEEAERLGYVVLHFWDRFTDTARVYACDSTVVNGVRADALESQVGLYATLLDQVPLEEGVRSVSRLFDRVEAFERKYPESNVFEELCRQTSRYFYDPNSPVRNEDLYRPFVEKLAASDLIDDGYRKGYEWDARMCRLNGVGTQAADFPFTDTRGKLRTLHGVKAEYTLLIFANPGCNACQEITAAMKASPEISALVDAGRLKVVDVYIDQEIEDWKAHIADYPADWINGYDQDYTIRTDLVYNIRAIPSIYLLDRDKTVLMKDAPQEKVLGALVKLYK